MTQEQKRLICLWLENIKNMAEYGAFTDVKDQLANIVVHAKEAKEFIEKYWDIPRMWED